MRRALVALGLLCCLAIAQGTSVVTVVKAALTAGDMNFATQFLAKYKAAKGTTPEYIEALSWLGRAEFNAKDYAGAGRNAEEVRRLCLDQLAKRKLDAEPSLPMALGASIEVQAGIAAAQGRRDEAVSFLRAEDKRWAAASIQARIRKNLNLLTLEGKPAPILEVARGLTDTKPKTLLQHRGHPLLLFFWAHWCSDCKNEIAIIARLEKTYGARGLTVIAPTRHYGYVAGGQDANPEVETRYIKQIFGQYYSGLGSVEVPLSEANFTNYGVSTTPTLVLIDGRGVVRLYNPGNATYEELSARIEKLI